MANIKSVIKYQKWLDDEHPDEEQLGVAVESLAFRLKALPEEDMDGREEIKACIALLNKFGGYSTLVDCNEDSPELTTGITDLDYSNLVDHHASVNTLKQDVTILREMMTKGLISKGIELTKISTRNRG